MGQEEKGLDKTQPAHEILELSIKPEGLKIDETIVNNKGTNTYHAINPSQTTLSQDTLFDISIPSLILIIVGWCVIYHNAKKLATRNETKSLIDELVSQIDKLEKLTTDYWLSGRQSRLDTDAYLLLINAKTQLISSRLKTISHRKIDISGVDLSCLSELMTLNCEDVDKHSLDEKREQMQSFLNEVNEGIESLYSEFYKSYKPSFPIFN